jgi:hypothetical protein
MKRGRRHSHPNESIPLEAIPVRSHAHQSLRRTQNGFPVAHKDSFFNLSLVIRFAESQCQNLICIRAAKRAGSRCS